MATADAFSTLDELEALTAIRQRRAYHLRWPAALERRFRASQRRYFRRPRTVMFLAEGLLTGLASNYGADIFAPSPEALLPLTLISQAIGLLLVLTSAVTFWWPAATMSRAMQVASVCLVGWFCIGLSYASSMHWLRFPQLIAAATIMSFVIFGGYPRRWMMTGLCVVFGSIIVITALYEPGPLASNTIYGLGVIGFIQLFSAYTLDGIARVGWIDGRFAALMARIDPLTGLSNRNELNRLLGERFAQARRERKLVAVMLIDLDHFKRLNDSQGHLVGDQVLRDVGHLIVRHYARRPQDLRVRYGGEEFLIIWYDVEPYEVLTEAERLLADIGRIQVAVPAGIEPVVVSASGGLTLLVPEEDVRDLSVLRRADELLYRAKSQGRRQLVIDPQVAARAAASKRRIAPRVDREPVSL